MKQRAVWWTFGVAVLAVLGVLLAASQALVGQERAQQRSELEGRFHEDLRTALYRMDHLLGPLMARELGRLDGFSPKAEELRAFSDPGREAPVWVWDLELATRTLAPGARLDPAVVAGLRRDVAEPEPNPAAVWPADAELEQQELELASNGIDWVAGRNEQLANDGRESRGASRTGLEYGLRQYSNALNNFGSSQLELRVGPLITRWHDEPGGQVLLCARRCGPVAAPAGVVGLQVVRIDWSRLRALLLAEVRPFLPRAELLPAAPDADLDEVGDRLATIPARLSVEAPRLQASIGRSLGLGLAITWIATLTALSAVALALRATLAYGDRHRRFTSAVTHELRTPLTTFRLYSEMLAKGMVPEGSRVQYLETLEEQARRLSVLVENVLAYARLDEGRAPVRSELLTIGELVERHRAALERCCATADARLELEPGAAWDLELRTDPEAVGQILGNLVDNACKYGCLGESRAISLGAAARGAELRLRVHDEGPGVPAAETRAIFEPFDRGSRDESDAAPGVGLGLALSRDLARALGGDLRLVRSSQGATFELVLPGPSERGA